MEPDSPAQGCAACALVGTPAGPSPHWRSPWPARKRRQGAVAGLGPPTGNPLTSSRRRPGTVRDCPDVDRPRSRRIQADAVRLEEGTPTVCAPTSSKRPADGGAISSTVRDTSECDGAEAAAGSLNSTASEAARTPVRLRKPGRYLRGRPATCRFLARWTRCPRYAGAGADRGAQCRDGAGVLPS